MLFFYQYVSYSSQLQSNVRFQTVKKGLLRTEESLFPVP